MTCPYYGGQDGTTAPPYPKHVENTEDEDDGIKEIIALHDAAVARLIEIGDWEGPAGCVSDPESRFSEGYA